MPTLKYGRQEEAISCSPHGAGPICTDDKVIADGSLQQLQKDAWRRLIGVEMEAGDAAYFTGVWEQIQSVSAVAAPLVQRLAHLGVASARQLAEAESDIRLEDVIEPLTALQRRDVIRLETERLGDVSQEAPLNPQVRWKFSVPLLQQWLSARVVA